MRFTLLLAPLIALGGPILSGCSEESTVDLGIDDDSSGAGTPANYVPADGVAIHSISLNQGVKRPLMEFGVASNTTLPIVAARNALLRVFYSTDANYNAQPVVGRLTIGDNPPIDTVLPLGAASTDELLSSTVNFEVPGEYLAQATTYRVDLLHAESLSSGTNPAAGYPPQGQEAIPVQSAGASLKIALVPIQYNADGSGRLPDTSPEQLERYRTRFYRTYPAPAIDVVVREPLPWNSTVAGNGAGWDALLDYMFSHRQASGTAADEYLYGVFVPTATFQQFCVGGCVTGLSLLAGPSDVNFRVGIGLGYTGDTAATTAIHEVGHGHGRNHAPCNVFDGVDPSYPYGDGSIGTWGYDLLDGVLLAPDAASDMMGYCDPSWVSDYTFAALFSRIKLVNLASYTAPTELLDRRYERLTLRPDGSVKWHPPMDLHFPPTGEPITVDSSIDGVHAQLQGSFFPYSHLDGGIVLIAANEQRLDHVRLRAAGVLYEGTRNGTNSGR